MIDKDKIFKTIICIIIAILTMSTVLLALKIDRKQNTVSEVTHEIKRPSTMFYSGETPPLVDGNDGDFYIDTSSYILYKRMANKWIVIMENFGKPGENGNNEAWIIGDDCPTLDIGNIGDMYLDKLTCLIYKKTNIGWEYISSLQMDSPNTIYITSPSDWLNTLKNIEKYQGKVIKLKNDLDFSYTSYEINEINASSWTNKTLIIDGGGFKIKNITCLNKHIESMGFNSNGLIAGISNIEQIKIKNLTLENCKFSSNANISVVGGFCAQTLLQNSSQSIEFNNCKLINSQITSSKHAGGFIGYTQGATGNIKIIDCIVDNNTISGKSSASGFIAVSNTPYEILSVSSNKRCKIINNQFIGEENSKVSACIGMSMAPIGIIGLNSFNVYVSNNKFVVANTEKDIYSPLGIMTIDSGCTVTFNGKNI